MTKCEEMRRQAPEIHELATHIFIYIGLRSWSTRANFFSCLLLIFNCACSGKIQKSQLYGFIAGLILSKHVDYTGSFWIKSYCMRFEGTSISTNKKKMGKTHDTAHVQQPKTIKISIRRKN